MALIMMDGFEYGGSGTQDPTVALWDVGATGSVSSSEQIRSGAYAVHMTQNEEIFTKDLSVLSPFTLGTDTLYMGFAMYAEAPGWGGGVFTVGSGTLSNVSFWLTLSAGADGSLALYAADTEMGTDVKLGSTSAINTLVAAAWHWVEIEWKLHDTTGRAQIYVDGILVSGVGGTSIDTKQPDTGTIPDTLTARWDQGGTGASTADLMIDDVVIWDDRTVGSDPFTAFPMGDMEIEALKPTADTAQADFTAVGETTRWNNLDDTPANDAQYNESATATDRDIQTMANRTHTGTPLAVQLVTRAEKDDANAKTFAPILTGSSLQVQSTETLSETPIEYVNQFAVDIDAAVWTNTKVNAIEAGYEVVA